MNKTPIRTVVEDIDYVDLDDGKLDALVDFLLKYRDREDVEFQIGGNTDSGYYMDIRRFTVETPEQVEERLERELTARIKSYENSIKMYSNTLEGYKQELEELKQQQK